MKDLYVEVMKTHPDPARFGRYRYFITKTFKKVADFEYFDIILYLNILLSI